MSETQKPADTTTPESSSANAKTAVVEPTVPERPIRIFGDYELVEELGQGAMGIVYRARQKSAGRFVAIKLIRQDLLHGLAAEKQKNAIERFRTEAKAAAQLEHEHIVTVYDVGEIDGQPYFSMRLVEGASMSDLLRDGPMENRRVAKLMEPLARAIHQAHTRGIIHRDLKPQNIMIDLEREHALVADFGLAKLMENEGELTRDGEIMGTPQYMSPEQAVDASGVTSQTDIYALGATLYHSLTGRPPFQAVTALETLRQVMFDEPVPPKQLNPAIDRDLETICLKCLEKEPARRYVSADELGDELGRYLRNEPIHARQIGRVGRAWRWCRRNPAVSAMIALVVVSLIVALIATSIGYVVASRAHRKSETAHKKAVAAQRESEESFRQALGAVNDFFTRVSEDDLLNQPGMQGLRKEFLERALGYYSKFLERRGDDPELRDEVGLTFYRVGRITEAIESPEAALQWYERARQIQSVRVANSSDDVKHLEPFGNTLNAIGRAYQRGHESEKALDSYDEATSVRRKLVKLAPENTEFHRQLANSYMNMGLIDRQLGEVVNARKQFELAQSIRLTQLTRTQDAVRLWRDLGMGYYNLGYMDYTLAQEADYDGDERGFEERTKNAVESLDDAVKAFKKSLSLAPDNLNQQYQLAVSYRILADVKLLTGQSGQALANYRQALGPLTMLVERNPQVPTYQAALAGVHLNVAFFEVDEGDSKAAIVAFETATRLLQPLLETQPEVLSHRLDCAMTLYHLSELQSLEGKKDISLVRLHAARQLIDDILKQSPDDPQSLDLRADIDHAMLELRTTQAGDQ